MSKFLRIVEIIIALPRIVLMEMADYCPFGKIGLAFISFGAFTLVFTFWVAMILFSSLLIHEIGHAWASYSKGRGVKGIYLLPFCGYCMYGDGPASEKTKIFCSLMGPVFSIALALILGVIFFLNKETVFVFCSFVTALLSVYDLIPIKLHKSQLFTSDGSKIFGMIFLSGKIRGPNLMLFGVVYIILIVIGLGIAFFSFSNDFLEKTECFFQPFFCNGISFWINFFKEYI